MEFKTQIVRGSVQWRKCAIRFDSKGMHDISIMSATQSKVKKKVKQHINQQPVSVEWQDFQCTGERKSFQSQAKTCIFILLSFLCNWKSLINFVYRRFVLFLIQNNHGILKIHLIDLICMCVEFRLSKKIPVKNVFVRILCKTNSNTNN